MIGCSMGSCSSPSVIDVRMYEITCEIMNNFPYRHKVLFHTRYRDDGFIIFNGPEHEIHQLFEIANSHHPLIKFTYETSYINMNFLDTTIYKGSRFETSQILDLKTFNKPTNTFQFLDLKNAHNPAVFKGFIKGELIRHLRNTSDENKLYEVLREFKIILSKRGYDNCEIEKSITDALHNQKRSNALNSAGKKPSGKIPLFLVTKYNPCITLIKRKLLKYWHILKRDKNAMKSSKIYL